MHRGSSVVSDVRTAALERLRNHLPISLPKWKRPLHAVVAVHWLLECNRYLELLATRVGCMQGAEQAICNPSFCGSACSRQTFFHFCKNSGLSHSLSAYLYGLLRLRSPLYNGKKSQLQLASIGLNRAGPGLCHESMENATWRMLVADAG